MKNVSDQPPDIAIALKYDGEGAPKVTAKGRGEVAAEIIAEAENHAIPLHSDEALVEFLSRVPLGQEIPEPLYRAVAEIIAFAFYVSGKMPPGYIPEPPAPHTSEDD